MWYYEICTVLENVKGQIAHFANNITHTLV